MIQYHGWTVVDRQNPNLQFERNVLCRFCGEECVSIQEVIERTEISYTKSEPNAKNGIRTAVAEQKQQEVFETEHITQQRPTRVRSGVRSKYNTSDSLMALFSGNHANPPDHKWHSMRRKSSAKRKFYKGHRSLSREKSVFSKRYTVRTKTFI